jgi:MerR family transcriptional regulator, light-induced transcriptional regulator
MYLHRSRPPRPCQVFVQMLYSLGMDSDGVLRIGELSKRSGVSPELLRAWERRYGLLRPVRSAGGLRLYTPADVERVRVMRQHLADGLAAAEAAALALRPGVGDESTPMALRPEAVRDELADALDRYDEPGAQMILDRLLAVATVDTVLSEVVLPYLRELGERWLRGDASVAQEHFASSVVRGRLLGLARGWGLGLGPTAVLACLPGEQHDLGLIAFGLALRSRGWRIVYLGSDSPIETVEEVSRQLDPSLVVLTAVSSARVEPVMPQLRALAARHRLALGGAAAENGAPGASGALALPGDPIAEAAQVTTLVQGGGEPL